MFTIEYSNNHSDGLFCDDAERLADETGINPDEAYSHVGASEGGVSAIEAEVAGDPFTRWRL